MNHLDTMWASDINTNVNNDVRALLLPRSRLQLARIACKHASVSFTLTLGSPPIVNISG